MKKACSANITTLTRNFCHYIKELANIMTRNARQPDAVCRMGGDELIILLPSTPSGVAYWLRPWHWHRIKRAQRLLY